MHYGYEGLGIFGFTIFIAFIVISICITLAPLVIWRNGNRTNRLLALIALHQGIPAQKIQEVFSKGGGDLPRAVYDAEKIKDTEAKYSNGS
jgi:hypothetical protein